MSPQRRNNPDVESPAQEFPSRPRGDRDTSDVELPADDPHGTVSRDEEE